MRFYEISDVCIYDIIHVFQHEDIVVALISFFIIVRKFRIH